VDFIKRKFRDGLYSIFTFVHFYNLGRPEPCKMVDHERSGWIIGQNRPETVMGGPYISDLPMAVSDRSWSMIDPFIRFWTSEVVFIYNLKIKNHFKLK
jgi:hypothetical protein